MCPYDGCNKLYGSDVALNLHVKLKHNGGNKTERERLAVIRLFILERNHLSLVKWITNPPSSIKIPTRIPRCKNYLKI